MAPFEVVDCHTEHMFINIPVSLQVFIHHAKSKDGSLGRVQWRDKVDEGEFSAQNLKPLKGALAASLLHVTLGLLAPAFRT